MLDGLSGAPKAPHTFRWYVDDVNLSENESGCHYEEKKKFTEVQLKAYHKQEPKSPNVSAKTSVTLDVNHLDEVEAFKIHAQSRSITAKSSNINKHERAPGSNWKQTQTIYKRKNLSKLIILPIFHLFLPFNMGYML